MSKPFAAVSVSIRASSVAIRASLSARSGGGVIHTLIQIRAFRSTTKSRAKSVREAAN
jgi:hypothetical protein